MKYLRERQEYIDRYDRLTVWDCRRMEKRQQNITIKKPKNNKGKHTVEILHMLSGTFIEMILYYMAGDAYKKKEGTITKWMDEDKKKDEILDNAEQPRLVRCKTCLSSMNFSNKHLWGDKDDKVLFFFDCPKGCLPNRLIFENGEEYQPKPELCEKCKGEVTRKMKRKENIITTTKTCTLCGNVETDDYDLSPEPEIEDPEYEKDKARFCMTDKEGYDFIDGERNRGQLNELLEKDKDRKEHKELYDKVDNLKKYTVPQIKQYITESLKDETYSNLIFEQPKMDLIVSVGFTIEDPTNQQQYDSRIKLQRLFKKILIKTNWRLMNEGISYRLGILSGRIRIYEKEEDLVRLVNSKK